MNESLVVFPSPLPVCLYIKSERSDSTYLNNVLAFVCIPWDRLVGRTAGHSHDDWTLCGHVTNTCEL